jgi:hypothetical protein
VVNRVVRALDHFKARGQAGEIAGTLNTQAELDANAVESSYTMIRVFIWAIPILGFIGTVLGISRAVGGFSEALAEAAETSMMTEALGAVTTNLAFAFDTTLVALVMSVLVMIPASSMQKSEEDLLGSVDAYCNQALLPRLLDEASENCLKDSVQQAVDASLTQHEQRLEQWTEQLHTTCSTVADAVSAAWRGMHEEIRQGHHEHANELRGVAESIGAQREDFVSALQSVQDHHVQQMSNQFAQVLKALDDQETTVIQRWQMAQDSQAERLGEIAEKMESQASSTIECLHAAETVQAEKLERVIDVMAQTAGHVQQQIAELQQSQLNDHRSVVAELAANLRQLQQESRQQHETGARHLQEMTVQFSERLAQLGGDLDTVRNQFVEACEGVGPAIQTGVQDVVKQVEVAFQGKVLDLVTLAKSIEGRSESLSKHLSEFQQSQADTVSSVGRELRESLHELPEKLLETQQVPLANLIKIAETTADRAELVQKELTATRSAIDVSKQVANELHKTNGATRRTVDELTSSFQQLIDRQMAFAASQRELSGKLERMVTSDAFGQTLTGMNRALRGLLAAVDHLNGQLEQNTAQKQINHQRRGLLELVLGGGNNGRQHHG